MSLEHAHGVTNPKCKHPACIKACARYLKRWRYERSHGLLRLTDPAAVRLHIATLQGAGWSMRAIAAEAGTSPTTISRYMGHDAAKVTLVLVERIMSIDPEQIPSKASTQTTEPFVPRTGTVRRIQALMAIGYSHADLAARGIDSRNLLNQQGRWVTRTTHDNVAEKYRQLSRRPGPTDRSIREAVKRGYLGPAAWDDIDRDPEPEPEHTTDTTTSDELDENVVERILTGDVVPATNAERREVVRRWPTTGRSLNELERLTGWKTERYVDRDGAAA